MTRSGKNEGPNQRIESDRHDTITPARKRGDTANAVPDARSGKQHAGTSTSANNGR